MIIFLLGVDLFIVTYFTNLQIIEFSVLIVTHVESREKYINLMVR